MATVSIEIPDQHVTRVVDAICEMGHYDPALGLTKNQFAKAEIQRMIKERVLRHERRKAEEALPQPDPLEM